MEIGTDDAAAPPEWNAKAALLAAVPVGGVDRELPKGSAKSVEEVANVEARPSAEGRGFCMLLDMVGSTDGSSDGRSKVVSEGHWHSASCERTALGVSLGCWNGI